jgi:hypothetical protein
VSSRGHLWNDRRRIGASAAQTRAANAGSVDFEGGGFNPTLCMGGGAAAALLAAEEALA